MRSDCRRWYVLSLLYGRKGDTKKQAAILDSIRQRYVYQPYVLVAKYHAGLVTEKEFLNRINDYWICEKNDLLFGLAEECYQRREYSKALGFYRMAVEHSNKVIDLNFAGYFVEQNDIFYLLSQQRVAELEQKGVK
jgi:hypothetical protein